ncbi:MFS transporter [Acidiplasma cupricumulans]|uniref:Major facilitator superfamily (MFS) profile domain-containing protein n=3 Tax=Acidiplasma TaxID=507753 RepID=A0A0Q0VRW0_9ARCH|nr:MFS transporter [Acidiplasma cupricumulans]KQB36613.1 hypothetical protein AOG55_03575 [Acidiplasma cupricumulans]
MNRYYVLLVTTLSTLMAAVDSTIVYLALPEIGENFQTNVSNLTLVIVIYIISSTVMLAPAIEIIKKFGNREFYITGFSLFTASSLFVALSPGINFMIISRFFEGIGAGIMTATDIPIILNAFPQEERGRAVGINSISWSVGTLMGPLLGGFLVLFNWRYIFLINVPVGILAIFFAFKFIKKSKKLNEKINFTSSIAMLVFLVPLIIGISFINIYYLIISAIIFPFFFYAQYRRPVISRNLLKSRQFSLISIASFLESFAFFSVLYAMSIYYESYLGISSLDAGILIFPYPLASIISSPLGGYLYDRYGHGEVIMNAGILLEGVSIMFIGLYLSYIPELLFLAGLGGSLFWSPSTTMITDARGYSHRTEANNSLFILRNMGMIISISMLPVFMFIFGHSGHIINIYDMVKDSAIKGSIRYYLIFTSTVALSGLIFGFINIIRHRNNKTYWNETGLYKKESKP